MMPEPGSRPGCSASQASRCAVDGSRARPGAATSGRGCRAAPAPSSASRSRPRPSTSATSSTTRLFAVAVVASTGMPSGSSGSRVRSRRKSGRKSCPQSLMQCASSTTSSPQVAASCGSTLSRKSGLFSRSGDSSSTSTSPARIVGVGVGAILRVGGVDRHRADAGPLGRRDLVAHQGQQRRDDHGRPGCPAPRSSAVATKYTADLPQPVRCTTSARRRSAHQRLDRRPLVVAQHRMLAGQRPQTGLGLLAELGLGDRR